MSGDPPRLHPKDVARALAEIATLMELNGRDPFRTRAFASAARALEGTDADLPALAAADALTTLPGIGPGIASVIREIVLTGRSTIRDELEAATPLGLFDLLRIPGLGPKGIRTVHETLDVESLDDLERVARSGELATVPGLGAKTVEKILTGIDFARASSGRRRYPEALEAGVRILEWLRSRDDVLAAEIAGGLRRRLEVVDRIDLVAATDEPEPVLQDVSALNGADDPLRDPEDTVSIRLPDGVLARVRCVHARELVGAMVWETGNDGHLAALSARAAERGLALDRCGLLRGEERIALADEEALYAALGLAYLPPELREGLGEIELAAAGRVPRLVGTTDLAGTFHCHTDWSDGKATLAEMAEAARELGWSYLGIADHSRAAAYAGGLSIDRVYAQRAELDAWNAVAGGGFRLFHGVESDILPDGSLDYPDEVLAGFDYVVGSVHSSFGMSREEMTARVVRALRSPYLTILGHPTGRLLLTRRGFEIDLDEVVRVAAEEGVVIEINANPHRLDLDWREVRGAVGRGVLVAINPDAHSVTGLEHVAFGVNVARKAGLEPEQIVNCWSLDRVESYLAERKQARQS